jgi:hypothetical protein
MPIRRPMLLGPSLPQWSSMLPPEQGQVLVQRWYVYYLYSHHLLDLDTYGSSLFFADGMHPNTDSAATTPTTEPSLLSV